jgi:hypothetical protein
MRFEMRAWGTGSWDLGLSGFPGFLPCTPFWLAVQLFLLL